MSTELNEPILPDDHPIYGDYFYVADGQVYRSDWHNITVRQLKHHEGFKEVRRCDIVGRYVADDVAHDRNRGTRHRGQGPRAQTELDLIYRGEVNMSDKKRTPGPVAMNAAVEIAINTTIGAKTKDIAAIVQKYIDMEVNSQFAIKAQAIAAHETRHAAEPRCPHCGAMECDWDARQAMASDMAVMQQVYVEVQRIMDSTSDPVARNALRDLLRARS